MCCSSYHWGKTNSTYNILYTIVIVSTAWSSYRDDVSLYDYVLYLFLTGARSRFISHCIGPQAFVVAGGVSGVNGLNVLSSVLTLLPGATTWTQLASLPRGRFAAQLSTVGGNLRLIGGDDDVGNSVLDEVSGCQWRVGVGDVLHNAEQ